MSSGGLSGHRSRSSASRELSSARHTPPPTTLTPENTEAEFEPCAATASFLLYAQRNLVLVLHHDTLAIERRFALHREDVLWVSVDNASERGSGRLAVSYDAGNTAIVWDILTGGEVARFSAYEHIKVASFMRNGNIAFGNDQGNIILFEPATSEHISARTIFDPITAVAPSADCRTFAIGYLNGSILVATLQPSFTILHTLTTTRAPSRITGLAWHGSSSKQKTDMLATQTGDGDLRVWSIPKPPHQEQPNIIRVLQRADVQQRGPCWFAWSKSGRIVQYAEGETRAWDVRTKKVSWDIIPTVHDVIGIANYGPTATMFTLSRNHFVQQYDITPNNIPMQVASVQHVPANTPPTPPTTLEESKNPYNDLQRTGLERGPEVLTSTDESSADESAAMSPLQKISREMDSLQSESRDKVMPLSPNSSRASSTSSRSSDGRRRGRKYLYDRPDSSRASTTSGYEPTEFSMSTGPARQAHESISIRSVSSFASASNSRYRPTHLRKEVMRSPEEAMETSMLELFPYTKSRIQDVPFRTPHYGNFARTPELLQREMLSVIFGWNDTAEALVRDELERMRPGSASAVLLRKWLGDMGTDTMASMVGSESMSSSDWMLLALSSIGADTQKQVGEAFVQRLLEKGDVHPAVAILMGLGEHDEAIEVYVSQQCWLEAVLLTCLNCAADWGRISFLIRKWGEAAVGQGQAELAVRCFSCTSIETSEPWFSPRAQDAVYAAQQERFTRPPSAGGVTSPPNSPPSRSASGRLTAKNASLKLITTFGDKGAPVGKDVTTPMNAHGVTPISQSALQSAMSPGPADWPQPKPRTARDPSSARTATPGGFGRRKRLPSRSDIERAKQETAHLTTPITASRDFATPGSLSRKLSSAGSSQDHASSNSASQSDRLAPDSALKDDPHLPSPAHGIFTRLKEQSWTRNESVERKPDGLAVQVSGTQPPDPFYVGPTADTGTNQSGAGSPPLTDGSTKSGKGRAIHEHISSVEEAREQARPHSKRRGDNKRRDTSRAGRATSRNRELSETREKYDLKYIKPAKRSPTSPIPMSPEEIAQATQASKIEPATTDDESFYKVASPMESHKSMRSAVFEPKKDQKWPAVAGTNDSNVGPFHSHTANRQKSPDGSHLRSDSGRGRSEQRTLGSSARSPSSPLPMPLESAFQPEQDQIKDDGRRNGAQAGSRAESRSGRERSASQNPATPGGNESSLGMSAAHGSKVSVAESSGILSASESKQPKPRGLSRKELAAKELEERRLSLARRPSAPSIPLPSNAQLNSGGPRPSMGHRSNTELGNSPTSYSPPYSRAHTVDPDQLSKYGKISGTSTPSTPIGLPATPRAMRHPRYMGSDTNERESTPPVPEIPDNASQLSSLGSNLSEFTSSNVGSNVESNLTSNLTSNTSHLTSNMSQLTSSALSSELTKLSEVDDGVAPLLPSTVFGQKGSHAPPTRAASAPPENQSNVHRAYKPGLPHSNRRLSHVRKISPPDASQATQTSHHGSVSSIDGTIAGVGDQQVVIVPDERPEPPVLPELQHLAGPPPPPPPPTMHRRSSSMQVRSSEMINVVMDENVPQSATDLPSTLPSLTYPQLMERATTTSPSTHRRGRGSVGETFSSRFRGFGERMRSTSRNRTKSPEQASHKASPYETVLPPLPAHHEHEDRAKSPYEQALAAQNENQTQTPPPPPPPPAPPAFGTEGRITETTIPPSSLPRSQSATSGYRNPKEIRANMPPHTLQQGVFGPGGFL